MLPLTLLFRVSAGQNLEFYRDKMMLDDFPVQVRLAFMQLTGVIDRFTCFAQMPCCKNVLSRSPLSVLPSFCNLIIACVFLAFRRKTSRRAAARYQRGSAQ